MTHSSNEEPKLELRVFIHEGGQLPQRGKRGDAGIDVFARISNEEIVLENTADIGLDRKLEHQITVKQFGLAKIPLGFSYSFFVNGEVSHDYFLDVRNRSGVGTKSGFVTVAEVGDANYRGEIHYCVAKITEGSYVVKNGAKIAQAIITPFVDPHKVNIRQVWSLEELGPSDRGSSGFGGSGF